MNRAAPSSYGASLRLLLLSADRRKVGARHVCGIVRLKRVRVCTLAIVFRHYRCEGSSDGGLDSRPVIKRLFRGFLNRISISARPFHRRGKRRKAASCSVRKYGISRLNGCPIYTLSQTLFLSHASPRRKRWAVRMTNMLTPVLLCVKHRRARIPRAPGDSWQFKVSMNTCKVSPCKLQLECNL